jgi:hypothetical protein
VWGQLGQPSLSGPTLNLRARSHASRARS